jgi:BTB/POZ domain
MHNGLLQAIRNAAQARMDPAADEDIFAAMGQGPPGPVDAKVGGRFGKFFNSEHLSDIDFYIGPDRVRVYAHRVILATSSTTLAKMFDNDVSTQEYMTTTVALSSFFFFFFFFWSFASAICLHYMSLIVCLHRYLHRTVPLHHHL